MPSPPALHLQAALLVLCRLAVPALVSLAALLAGGTLTPVRAETGTRLAVPFLTQFDGTAYAPTNCGPTSLAMVWRFLLDERITPDAVRRQLMRLPGGGYAADPEQGTAIQDLARVARARGIEALMGPSGSSTGWSPSLLAEQVQQGHPVIVLTRLNQLPGWSGASPAFDHWVVITGATEGSFTYNDPAMPQAAGSNRPISRAQLTRAMQLSSVPTQGAAFAGPGGAGGRFAGAISDVAPESPAEVFKALVKLGNGSKIVTRVQPAREPAARHAGASRFAALSLPF